MNPTNTSGSQDTPQSLNALFNTLTDKLTHNGFDLNADDLNKANRLMSEHRSETNRLDEELEITSQQVKSQLRLSGMPDIRDLDKLTQLYQQTDRVKRYQKIQLLSQLTPIIKQENMDLLIRQVANQ
jgi:hypothetical protein